ncbi:hypothetical protein AJ79_05093 [Helicocarpus griseus UAMH5409]|uniref:Smr domain-containing protein n=1 Tax=Helicocarpus griseus UAMH5409 TaxID=1447875 RepID=A0A2B7XQK6_9EURO|nr:hypothetical protein AJ79_05093 [Helicocarpus griseus UAMH5409]
MDDSVESLLKGLEDQYCPPLDPALFAAIAYDYDLLDKSSLQQLRDTLDALKISAVEQENTPFDPSGTSGQDLAGDQDEFSSELDGSHPTLNSLTSNITSLESDFSSINLERDEKQKHKQLGRECNGHDVEASPDRVLKTITGLTLEAKTTYLMEMFPSIDHFTIVHTLRKCKEDVHRSMDLLLNLAFFEDQNADDQENKVLIPKGIEGFQGDISARGRKKAKNKRAKKQEILRTSSASALEQRDVNTVENKWDNSKKDVEFICSRTYLSPKAVTSAYHLNGASLPTTLHFLASGEADKHAKEMMDGPVTIAQIAELQQEFGTVGPEKLAGLLRLARNSTSAASELATVMITVKPPPPATEIVQIKPAPVDLDETPAQRTSSWTRQTPRDYSTTRAMANSHLLAGHSAFNKASAAYRRGKSDHLMGGAAGYYSSVGREHMERAKKEAAAAAEALVESQSSSKLLDLHGVSVQHAVGIAKRKVEVWWDSLGDTKYAPGGWGPAQEGYRIITGLGRHSKNGTARLGPAVARSLANEGWKIEVGEGYLTVYGKVRRR